MTYILEQAKTESHLVSLSNDGSACFKATLSRNVYGEYKPVKEYKGDMIHAKRAYRRYLKEAEPCINTI